jgi:regulatory protein
MRRTKRNDPDAARAPRRPRPQPTPAQRALALLVRREHSRPELTRKLLARGVEEADAAAAVTRMAEAGWQDDQRFASSVARSRAASGYGPAWIRAELGSHGIGEAMVDQALAALAETGDDDWEARARDLVERRFAGRLDTLAGQRKAADFLYRRGFDGDCVRSAVRG